jgi:hypothetical protein
MTGWCFRLLLMTAVAVLAGGCVTERDTYLDSAIHLRVLDARTLSPIVGARVTATSASDPAASRQAVSGPGGTVAIAPLKGSFTTLPFGSPLPVILTVRARGYKAYSAALPDVGSAATPTFYYRFTDMNPPPDAILLARR